MTQANFKENQFIWLKNLKKKAKIIALTRSIPTKYKVEIIVDFDKSKQQRVTQVITVGADEIAPYREKKQRQPLQIKVKYFDDEIQKLEKISTGDWIDLRAAETIELKQFEYKLIPLGVGMKLPKDYEVNIVPRSSTFKNFGVLQTNSFGVVDNSYSGDADQYHFPALAMRDTVIQKGDRICQMRINRIMPSVEFKTVDKLDDANRGGIGSTGTK